MPSDFENSVALVERGYNEETRCLNFRVDFAYPKPEALRAIQLIGGYNEFDGNAVAEALRPYLDKIMYLGVGREGSPVIYVRLFHHGPFDAIKNALRGVCADELDQDADGAIRAWWD